MVVTTSLVIRVKPLSLPQPYLKKIVLFLIYKNKHLTHLFEEGLQKLWNCQSIYEKANQLRCFHMYPFDLRRITSYMRLVHRI